jgi:type II secretory pathway pseudopilin PulG
MSTRQTRSHKAEKKAAAQASTFIENALEEVKRKRRSKSEGWPCTAEQITAERDTKGLSWKQVAVNLGLPNPGAARSAYTELTGRPHSDAAPVRQRAARSTTSVNGVRHKRNLVEWNDDTDQDEMIEALTHRDIVVRRVCRGITVPDEPMHVCRIVRFAYDGKGENGPLVVHVYTKRQCECRLSDPRDSDTGVARTFRVADIKEVIGWTPTQNSS